MAHNEWEIHSGVSLGIDWNSSSNATQVSIAPTIWRWDAYTTDNYGSYLAERLSPDPTGAGYWDGYEYGSGSGWRKIDSFATRTYTRTHSAQTVKLTLYTDSEFGTWYNGWVTVGSRSNTWTLTVDPKASYSVTYNANGGSGAPAAQTKWYGEDLTLQTGKPTYTGRTFKGWATTQAKANAGTVEYAAGAKYTGNAALVLYAVWQLNTWSVTYNGNGATGGSTAAQTKTYGVTLALRSNGFTRTNYVFKDWNTKSDGSGTRYAAGANYTGNAALALYAQWYPPYTVSYNANGGTGTVAAQTKVYNTALTLQANSYTRDGYQFWHWNTKADNTGTTYAASGSYTANAAATMYAIWNPIVTYDANGGTGAPGQQVKTYGTTLALSSTVPTRTGFSFKQWNTASDGTGASYQPGADYTANTALSLHAIWQATVSYDSNGGTGAPQPQTADYGATVTIPEITPTFAGRTFLGWNTARDGSGTGYQPGDTYSASNGDLALYAQWRIDIIVTVSECILCDSAGTADALGRHVKVTASYDTTAAGSDCTSFHADIVRGSTSETKQAASALSDTGTETWLFGPYTFADFDPFGGYPVGSVTASNADGEISVPISVPATGYKTPVVVSVEAFRTEEGTQAGEFVESDDGTDIGVETVWGVFQTPTQQASVHLEVYDMDLARTVAVRDYSPTSYSGNPTHSDVYPDYSQWPDDVIIDGILADTDRRYRVTVTLTDPYTQWAQTSASASDVVTTAFFTMDMLAGGHGVAFGMPSQREAFDVAMDAYFHNPVTAESTVTLEDSLTAQDASFAGAVTLGDSLTGTTADFSDVVTVSAETRVKDDSVSATEAPAVDIWGKGFRFYDGDDARRGQTRIVSKADGYQGVQVQAVREIGGTNHFNGFVQEIDAAGNMRVTVDQPEAWQQGLGVLPLAGGTLTGPLVGTTGTFSYNFYLRSRATRGTTPSANTYAAYEFTDTNGKRLAQVESGVLTNGQSRLQLYVLGHHTTSDQYGGILITKSNGNTGNTTLEYNANTGQLSGHTYRGATQSLSWVQAAKNIAAPFYAPKAAASGWCPTVQVDTPTASRWSIGNYNNENLLFAYVAKNNMDANTNTAINVNLRPASGTIALQSEVNPTAFTVTNGGSLTTDSYLKGFAIGNTRFLEYWVDTTAYHNGSTWITIGTVAAGYRPSRIWYGACIAGDTTRPNGDYPGYVRINTNGTVQINFMSGWGAGSVIMGQLFWTA